MRTQRMLGLGVAALATTALSTGLASATPTAHEDATPMIRDCVDVPNQTVRQGSRGDYVREVQCLLNYSINPNTFSRIAVDGVFGPMTRSKVIKFQQCVNANIDAPVLIVDGIVGPNTSWHLELWAQIEAYVC